MGTKSDYTKAGQELGQQHADRNGRTELVRQQMAHHQSFLRARTEQLARWCTHGLRPEALLRFCMLDLQQNEQLRKCETGSIYLGLLACAQAGLEPGALKQEAFLVPFFDGKAKLYRATFIAGWRGLIKQAKRSREVRNVYGNVVRQRDQFDLDLGTQPRIMHKPSLGDRGEVIGAYAVAQLAHGLFDPEWMGEDDLKRIEAQATRGGRQTPAWANWKDEMQRKSPIRRLAKRLPMGSDYFAGAAVEQAHDDEKPEIAVQVLDALTDGAASAAQHDASVGREIAEAVAGDFTDDDKRAIERAEALQDKE